MELEDDDARALKARLDAHLVMLMALMNGLRHTHIGIYNTAKRHIAVSEHDLTRTNAHGATLRELRLVLAELHRAEESERELLGEPRPRGTKPRQEPGDQA